MKKILTVLLIVLLALVALGVAGVFLLRHFVTNQIMDRGGMMNPDYIDEIDDSHILDGDHTYVDNEKLLQVITGTWLSEDGRYAIKLDSDCRITLSLDGEQLLDDHIQFVYLQPGNIQSTEFSLDSCVLQREDGSPVGEILSFYHEASDEDASGRLILEIDLEGNSKAIEFKNTSRENKGENDTPLAGPAPTDNEQAQAAMNLLRECMDNAPQIALAAACLGYREADDPTPLADWMWVNSPGLMEEMPFILTIPQDRILGAGYGDLYCLVPRDDNTTLAVNHVTWKSTGNGVWPEADEVLYRDERAQPVLVFVGYEEFPDEPDVGIHAIAGNGAQVEWYPFLDAEDGHLSIPTGVDYNPLILDFTHFGDINGLDYWDNPDKWQPVGDDGWLPPTDEGLADSQWNCGENWFMELGRGSCDPDYAGIADLYYQSEDGQEFQMLYSGVWRMEGDCLRLELSAGVGSSAGGSFPVLIDPSGDHLYIQQSRDGYTCPPFFGDDVTLMELTRSYG